MEEKITQNSSVLIPHWAAIWFQDTAVADAVEVVVVVEKVGHLGWMLLLLLLLLTMKRRSPFFSLHETALLLLWNASISYVCFETKL